MSVSVAFVVWKSLALIAFGMYTWEMLLLLPFDLSLLLGRRSLRWPYIAYLVCRYSLFGTHLGFQLFLYSETQIDCHGLYLVIGVLGNVTIGAAIAIWQRNKFITAALIITGCVQWALLVRDITKRIAHWDGIAMCCVVLAVPVTELLYIYLPSMLFDFLVLVLSTVGLLRHGPLHSGLQVLVFRHGLLYFMVTFAAHLSVVITAFLNIDDIFSFIFTIIATFVSTVASCRMVVSLAHFADQEEHRNHKRGHAQRSTAMPAPNSTTPRTESPCEVMLTTVVISRPGE